MGAIMGGIILGLLTNIIYFANITSFYQEFMKGVIIIVALLFGPCRVSGASFRTLVSCPRNSMHFVAIKMAVGKAA